MKKKFKKDKGVENLTNMNIDILIITPPIRQNKNFYFYILLYLVFCALASEIIQFIVGVFLEMFISLFIFAVILNLFLLILYLWNSLYIRSKQKRFSSSILS